MIKGDNNSFLQGVVAISPTLAWAAGNVTDGAHLKALRHFAAKANDPFGEIRVVTGKETLVGGSLDFANQLGQAADLIEKLISSNCLPEIGTRETQ